jgi:hypothetical protein
MLIYISINNVDVLAYALVSALPSILSLNCFLFQLFIFNNISIFYKFLYFTIRYTDIYWHRGALYADRKVWEDWG